VSPHDVAKLLYEIEELRAEHAQRTAERDEAWLTNATLRADLARANAERDALAAEIAALKAQPDPLAEMWAALEEYQPFANRDGHGESWAKMCRERTEGAASAAAADAAWAAAWAAARAADSVDAIRRAKEAKR
jgi:chromosome segregation ATPase